MAATAIRDLTDARDFAQAEDLQDVVWSFDPRGIVPAHVLYVAANDGGIVLGAYEGDKLAGFCLGFLGRYQDQLCHVSHLLAVHPDHRGQGIGTALKQAQRDRALSQGLDLMIWTFDPLQRRNAYLNLHVLRAEARTYRVNLYGDLNDSLNAGLPTDRLIAEWHLAAPSGRRKRQPVPLLAPDLTLDTAALTAATVSIAIPGDIGREKREDPSGAHRWRMAQREAFERALSAGFVAHDVIDGAYVLDKEQG
ncbi:MAG TPA: GNAT family N-acetyltransferase [Chloroflexota bacterium]|nr:GNAT family N-acetyltransferase [Chloroflexota bacterium]